jgi:hypothetical protein
MNDHGTGVVILPRIDGKLHGLARWRDVRAEAKRIGSQRAGEKDEERESERAQPFHRPRSVPRVTAIKDVAESQRF